MITSNLKIENYSHKSLILFLGIFSFFTLMFGNGIITLTHPDEVFYAQSAKEMLAHNSLLTPYLFNRPQFEKPIFYYWILMMAVKLLGDSPFVFRLGCSIFGITGVIVTYGMAWLFFQNKRIAFLSSMILATSCMYIILARAVLTDMVFSTWVVLSLGSFYWAYSQTDKKNLGIVFSFIFSALAVLTKGLLGLCFPLVTILGFLIVRRDLKFLKCRAFLFGLVIFIIFILPWHLRMYQLYGQAFVDEYFFNVHIRRLLEAEHTQFNHWYFYLRSIFLGMLPWSFYLIPAVLLMKDQSKISERHRWGIIFMGLWVFTVFIFLQPAQSKLASYIFPVFPALAISLAYYWDKVFEAPPIQLAYRISCHLFSLFLILGAIFVIHFANNHRDMIVEMSPIYVFAGLLILSAFFIIIFFYRKKYQFVMGHVMGITLIILGTLYFSHPYAEPWVSCKAISDQLKEIDQSNSILLVSKFYARGVKYYTNRKIAVMDVYGKKFFSPHPIPFLDTDREVLRFFKKYHSAFGIVKKSNFDDLKRILKDQGFTMILFSEKGGKYLVKIERTNS